MDATRESNPRRQVATRRRRSPASGRRTAAGAVVSVEPTKKVVGPHELAGPAGRMPGRAPMHGAANLKRKATVPFRAPRASNKPLVRINEHLHLSLIHILIYIWEACASSSAGRALSRRTRDARSLVVVGQQRQLEGARDHHRRQAGGQRRKRKKTNEARPRLPRHEILNLCNSPFRAGR
jgi:hypothetical protein